MLRSGTEENDQPTLRLHSGFLSVGSQLPGRRLFAAVPVLLLAIVHNCSSSSKGGCHMDGVHAAALMLPFPAAQNSMSYGCRRCLVTESGDRLTTCPTNNPATHINTLMTAAWRLDRMLTAALMLPFPAEQNCIVLWMDADKPAALQPCLIIC
ncbi:uncharacterized protein LOC123517073 isoform X1 [Portunus trituberculatus]|uniref:uncharacterized protein LOC123517073 isoform X1 n=1 Tax=Portunus trituberculatus TaxID=210409 RepID=UPI001E1D03F5|nr:uncharacterized protein LOC123517073 isoform X1 [Portunus trituberculatus]